MTDAKFTPGPWKTRLHSCGRSFVIETNDKTIICETDVWIDEFEEIEANAHLIAAAPALYRACKLVTQFTKRTRMNVITLDAMIEAEKADAKARGES